jgi:hypothetical protein
MSKRVIQRHHLIYENKEHHQDEVTGLIFKGEHWLLTNLNRRKNISKEFVRSVDLWLVLHRDEAVELTREEAPCST